MSHLASDEGHITIFPSAYDSIGQGSWTWYLFAGQVLNASFYNSSSLNGDEISYKVNLSSGIYTLNILATIGIGRGIMKCYIDDVEIASFDNYNPTYVYNVTKQQTGIVITTNGLKTLKLQVVGKNPLSTHYQMAIQNISLWRTD